MKKSKLILPIISISAIGTIAAPLITLTSCGDKGTTIDDTVEIVKKYTEFYNNYKTGDFKDKIYRTAELGTSVIASWTNDGTSVIASQINYDPVLDELIISDGTSANQLQLNMFKSPEYFRDVLKTYEMMSTSHKYTVGNDEIKFEFNQENTIVFSITFNKNGYITHYLKEKVEATFTLQDPTSTRLLEQDKFLIAYDKLDKHYKVQRTMYVTDDIDDKLEGVLKIENKPDAELQAVAFNDNLNYQTGDFGGSYTAVPLSIDRTYIKMKAKFEELTASGFNSFTFIYENWETNGISFNATDASSNTVVMSWNKDGYLTYDKEGTGASAYEITITYTKDPTEERPKLPV